MTMRILILGAGGQGQVLADALRFAAEAGQPVTPVGYLDDDPSLWQCAAAQLAGARCAGGLA